MAALFQTTRKRKRGFRTNVVFSYTIPTCRWELRASSQTVCNDKLSFLVVCIYSDEQQQQQWWLTDSSWEREAAGEGVSDWIDVLSSGPGGATPLPHRRKSSENLPLPGSHRWATREGRGRTPVLPGRRLLHTAPCTPIVQLPASSAKLGRPAVPHSSPQTSHAHAALHLEDWKLPHLHNFPIHTTRLLLSAYVLNAFCWTQQEREKTRNTPQLEKQTGSCGEGKPAVTDEEFWLWGLQRQNKCISFSLKLLNRRKFNFLKYSHFTFLQVYYLSHMCDRLAKH